MGKSKQNVKLTDVAELANVSIATASIIINNPEKNRFSEATRNKVLEAAEKLNYMPTGYIQQAKGKSIPTIGLVIPDLRNVYYPELASGFSRLANELGYQVILVDIDNSFRKEQSALDNLVQMKVSGIALCGAADGKEENAKEQAMIKRMMDAGIPVVQYDRYDTNSVCPYVGIDNFRAGYCMTEKMIQAGHRNLALLMNKNTSVSVHERKRGYKMAMEQYGCVPGIFEYDVHQYGSIYQQFHQIIQSDRRYTAIFTINGDIDAIECIRAAGKMGIRVPTDLSIAGFDDVSLAEVVDPALTTIYQPTYEIGETAMRLLASMIEERNVEEQNVILPFEYVVRESTRIV